MDNEEPTQPESLTHEALRRLVQRANDGDEPALTELRTVLDQHPEIWEVIGDLAAHAEAALISAIAGGDKLFSESLERKAAAMKQNLLGPAPTPLLELAVDRVVACWLQLQHVDAVCAGLTSPSPSEKPGNAAAGRDGGPAGTTATEPFRQPPGAGAPAGRSQPAGTAPKQTFSPRMAAFWSQRQDQAHRRYQAAVKLLVTVQSMSPALAGPQLAVTRPDWAAQQTDPAAAKMRKSA